MKQQLTFEITNEAYELLKAIGDGGAEYRDTEWKTLEDFKKANLNKSDDYFLNRNFGGTYHLIHELEEHGLVEVDGCSWHITYVLTPFAKKLI